MKKVIWLVIAVMLISSLLMASGPPLRIVRLTVINKSGNDVMIKLEGSEVGRQFYYLTIPAGTKTLPTVRWFTILEDIYLRTTYYGEGKYPQCVGVSSSGQLIMDRNTRLTFTPCYVIPMRRVKKWDPTTGTTIYGKRVNNGEPSMEKVVYYKALNLRWWANGDAYDEEFAKFYQYDPYYGGRINVYWKRGCGGYGWYGWGLTYNRVPTRGLCRWRYLYDKVHEW